MEGILDRSLEVALRYSKLDAFVPEYHICFKQLWAKHAGTDALWISCDGIRGFANDMVAAGFQDWVLSNRNLRDIDAFRDLGGMPLQIFAEFSENDGFDAVATVHAVATSSSFPKRVLPEHMAWLQRGNAGSIGFRNLEASASQTISTFSDDLNARGEEIVQSLRRDGVIRVFHDQVDMTLTTTVHDICGQLFDSIQNYKEPPYMQMSKQNRGFLDLRREQLSAMMGPDRKQLFDFGLPDDREMQCTKEKTKKNFEFRYDNRWPNDSANPHLCQQFREKSVQHGHQIQNVAIQLLHIIGETLQIPSSVLESQYKHPATVTRLLRYPPQSSLATTSNVNSLAGVEIGAGSHADYGALTVIIENQPGLEILLNQKKTWTTIPHVRGSMLVLTGHSLEKLTNGFFHATIHRVINRTNVDRQSTALFLDPDPDSIVAPLPQFCTQRNPCQYSPCEAGRKGVQFKNMT